MNADSGLPPDVRALLDAERGHVEMPTAAKARLARRLSPSLHASAASGAKTIGGWKAIALKGALVVAAAAGGTFALRHERAPREQPALSVRVAPPPVAFVAPAAPAPEIVRAPEVASAPPAVVVRAPVAKPLDAAERLEAERKLLDEARDALQRGEPERALEATDRHAARFAHGTLTEERYALRVRALVRLGRGVEARALASEMASRFPRSFLLEGVQRDAETIP
ncbi:MAG TPA: hypothetical protein VGH28_18250 [Polyangiaceae bacterium]|jgi:hypothetical protein